MRKVVLFFFISVNVLAQNQKQTIHGLWQNSQFGYQMTLMLQPDGSGEFDGEPIKFAVQQSVLSVTSAGQTTRYTYLLAENSLTLSDGDLDGKVTFTRSGQSNGSQQVPAETKASASLTIDKQLVGLWEGNGERMLFSANGICSYNGNGNSFQYKTSQGNVILTTAKGETVIPYSIAGNQLTMTLNGGQAFYYKQSEKTTSASKSVPQELVGQWCYLDMNKNSQTSRCITLNGDGTFFYSYEGSRSVNTETLYGGTSSQNSDSGTWYVEGDRIFYNSQKSGQGSYLLQKRNHPKNVNDPMIVLDGEAYVTMTARPPWR